MVARLNKPRGSAYSSRALTMPIAAVCMAGILYAYSVTSIRAAKLNAKLHREADGGQLDMRRESLRRHGVLDKVEGTSGLQLFRDSGANDMDESEAMGNNKARPLGQSSTEEQGSPRTEVESGLEQYKGVGSAVKKFKEIKTD